MKINLKKLTDTATIPTRGSEFAAGYDLYADIPFNIIIPSGGCEKIKTGIAIEIPENYFGGIYPRSGLATNKGLRPANCVGVIDADYRGELIVALRNDSDMEEVIAKGDRIAQLVIQPYLNIEFNEVEKLSETVRGAGGFGSTGINK